jgi:hypothetical protein
MWHNIHFLGVGLNPVLGEHEEEGPLSRKNVKVFEFTYLFYDAEFTGRQIGHTTININS